VGRRENHDAADFYARFSPPVVSKDEVVVPPKLVDRLLCGDARSMHHVTDGSVALVVTSPPYFAGKEYERALGEGHIPASYVEYLRMLEDVFAECARKLESGGRIAVNVANLGRKPYRSLAADVTSILQDRLGLLLRGEIVWQKARGATGSCAWGSFRSASNPVLRDLTERVIVAGKGRFDRALKAQERRERGLPALATITKDEFMEATLDLWELPPESATRVGHPAPFPVDLPQRLIELYTFEGDLVLDPFMGSGTTAVAAVRTGRHYVGYDTDASYVAAAEERVARERVAYVAPAVPPAYATATDLAKDLLAEAGFRSVAESRKAEVDLTAVDASGGLWQVLVCGGFTAQQAGLRRAEAVWRTLGRAAVLAAGAGGPARILVLTTHLPAPGTSVATALAVGHGVHFADALELLDPTTPGRLKELAGRPRRASGRR
jgi:site-specific DNA-methyltransferase (adenine-specific)